MNVIKVVKVDPETLPANYASIPLESLGMVRECAPVREKISLKAENPKKVSSHQLQAEANKQICLKIIKEHGSMSAQELHLAISVKGKTLSLPTVKAYLSDLRSRGLLSVEVRSVPRGKQISDVNFYSIEQGLAKSSK